MYVKKLKVKKIGNSHIIKVEKELLEKEVYVFDKEAYEDIMKLSYLVGRGSK